MLFRSLCCPSPPRRTDRYLGALQERDTDHLANDLAWLDRLIDAERNTDSNSSTESSTEDKS